MDTEKKISELFAIIKRLLSIIYSNGLAVDELTSKMMQDLQEVLWTRFIGTTGNWTANVRNGSDLITYKTTTIGVLTMDLTQITDKELEQMIYEAINEMIDSRFYKKLLAERKRRNLEQ